MQTFRLNNCRILRIKNAKFLEYYFYMNTNIQGDFQICISIPFSQMRKFERFWILQNQAFIFIKIIKDMKIVFSQDSNLLCLLQVFSKVHVKY